MKIKKGSKVKFINNNPTFNQDQIDMNKYIGREFLIIDHWQNPNNALEDGEIQVNIPEEGGIVILNKGEYEIVV